MFGHLCQRSTFATEFLRCGHCNNFEPDRPRKQRSSHNINDKRSDCRLWSTEFLSLIRDKQQLMTIKCACFHGAVKWKNWNDLDFVRLRNENESISLKWKWMKKEQPTWLITFAWQFTMKVNVCDAHLSLWPLASNELGASFVPTYRNTNSIVFVSFSSLQSTNRVFSQWKAFNVIYFGECNQFPFGDSRQPKCVKYVRSLRISKCYDRHRIVKRKPQLEIFQFKCVRFIHRRRDCGECWVH